jgi:hypothetical protein
MLAEGVPIGHNDDYMTGRHVTVGNSVPQTAFGCRAAVLSRRSMGRMANRVHGGMPLQLALSTSIMVLQNWFGTHINSSNSNSERCSPIKTVSLRADEANIYRKT